MTSRGRFKFRLYVAGQAKNSAEALSNLTAICMECLPDRYEIEVIDVFRGQVASARGWYLDDTDIDQARSATHAKNRGHTESKAAHARRPQYWTLHRMTLHQGRSDLEEEISSLTENLRQIEERLEHLTAGEVDAVLDSNGRSHVLQRTQELLRDLEAAKQTSILNALPAHIAILDARGSIVAVNHPWHEFAVANNLQGPPDAIGSNYIAVCMAARGPDSAGPKRTAEGISDVLSGAQKSFVTEYTCHSATEQRWFLMTVSPLSREGGGGAVIMHVNVTAKRRSEDNLRLSESRFRQMAENIRDIFFLESIDSSQMYYVSPSYERIVGRTCASLYERPASWGKIFIPMIGTMCKASCGAGEIPASSANIALLALMANCDGFTCAHSQCRTKTVNPTERLESR